MSDVILAICCLAAGLCTGIKFSEKYTEKFKFYKSIYCFNEQLFDEVVFFKNGIFSLEKNDYLSARFESLISNYSKGKKISNDLPDFLTPAQKNDIEFYFNNIGKSDVSTQKQLCDGFRSKFDRELKIAEEEQLKYSSLCKKVGVIVGVAAFIIIF